ncbi:uncharacterized protein DUF3857 [Chitinophaga skermanii]|uniref:Uncharacterized protein DUF3857 n=1 Tax=Chitinophaga skermanii TaxID=331697 RepID=A0A327QKY6_9BACT|nr:DUF3857 domain-containing protein [Chitinophaga skermanii]RAJ05326.1 uncharacterized protein DUF3857 [Chitinophaga skermanii]
MFQQKIQLVCCCLLLSLFPYLAKAQDKPNVKFGKVTVDDLKKRVYSIDSSANAVIILNVASSEYEGGVDGLSIVFKRQCRIHILNKNGFDLANVVFNIFKSDGEEERASKIAGTTYNLEGDKIVKTELNSNTVFTDKYDDKISLKKFTMPAVKEGSIIEFTYTIRSPFSFDIPNWEFQSLEAPTLWSEYTVAIPEFYEFIFLTQGYIPFHLKDKENTRKNYNIRSSGGAAAGSTASVDAGVTNHRFVMKDVPMLKEEMYTTTTKNHISKISFQLSATRYPNQPYRPVLSTWASFSENMLKREMYGAELEKGNGFLDETVEQVTAGAKTPLEKAMKIHAYVRDNFVCSDRGYLFKQHTFRETFKSKKGSSTEINLLLVAMLRAAKIEANPVLLSTRSHGKTYEVYPLMEKFNCTVVEVIANDQIYYIDGSYPYLGFNKLNPEVYNGHARVMNKEADPVSFDPDSLRLQKLTSVILIPAEDGSGMVGSIQQVPSYPESYRYRELIKEKGEDFLANDLVSAKGGTEVSNVRVDRLKTYEESLMLSFDVKWKQDKNAPVLYFNPMLFEANESNPFKSLDRFYPVEMNGTIDNTYSLTFTVPAGYEVEEMPTSSMIRLEDNAGVFQYFVAEDNGVIQLRSRIKLNKANFAKEDYVTLRAFFDEIVKKQAEQLVLKKKA